MPKEVRFSELGLYGVERLPQQGAVKGHRGPLSVRLLCVASSARSVLQQGGLCCLEWAGELSIVRDLITGVVGHAYVDF